MTIEKLVVKEFVVKEDDWRLETGETYTYFVDDYGKFYRPKEGFTITGEALLDKFEEMGDLEDLEGD
jgi:hypothetical protein